VYPFLGAIELGSITPTTIRTWIRWMTDRGLAPSYRHVCFVHVCAILKAAIDDKKIATNPCQARSVTRPHRGQPKVVPWTDARLKAVWLALSPRVTITVPVGAGGGLRQGEMFGLSPKDIDREAMVIRVTRQVQPVNNKLVFCLPKGEKTRDVPLSDRVLAELDAYQEMFPPVSVTLPWEEPDGQPTTVTLIMTDEAGGAWRRQMFNREYWQPALQRAVVSTPTRADGTHALRHYYASALLDGGETSKRSPNTSATPTPASPCAPTPTSCPPATNEPGESSTHDWATPTAWTRPMSPPIRKTPVRDGTDQYPVLRPEAPETVVQALQLPHRMPGPAFERR
jgi:integrase